MKTLIKLFVLVILFMALFYFAQAQKAKMANEIKSKMRFDKKGMSKKEYENLRKQNQMFRPLLKSGKF